MENIKKDAPVFDLKLKFLLIKDENYTWSWPVTWCEHAGCH